ncbi:hypothetical protein ACFW6E_45650 [Streptomyces olivaceoviridis]|uniref:hypothetical protein n=1 Tax=Streptomyces olivaceoviridis TaxID=1921 RepID=UPI0036C1BBD1
MTVIPAALRPCEDACGRDRLLWLLYFAAVQQDPGGGGGVGRELLERLMVGSDEATSATLAALRGGVSYVVWNGTTPAEPLALIYGRRLRHTRRQDVETTNLDRTVQLIGRHHQSVRLGQIRTADGSWVFMLFLAEDCSSLIACTGVRQTYA